MTPLTVACVWVQGNVDYAPEYVTRLRAMVAAFADRPHRFVCLTDRPDALPADLETVRIRLPKGCAGWWAKVQLFSDHAFGDGLARFVPSGLDTVPAMLTPREVEIAAVQPHERRRGRVLYLDLDTLVVAPLAPIIDYPAPFALVPDAGSFQPRNGLRVVKRFNSSVMVWDAGGESRLFNDWTPAVAARLWGDQDWIGEQRPSAETMPLAWFPRLSEMRDGAIPDDAKVVLCKKPKNADAAKQWPWFAERWIA